MNSKQIQKLETLLSKRQQKIEALNHFDSFFEKFSYSILKRITIDINDRLESFSNESIKLFYENPYEKRRSRNFVMLQLISGSYRRNDFFLDNTSSYPSLIFEGDEFTGRVKSTISFENKINKSSEHDIIRLIEDEYVTELIINFLDTVYSL